MATPSAADLIATATSPRDLARTLGVVCLDKHESIALDRATLPIAAALADHLEEAIENIGEEEWDVEENPGAVAHILGLSQTGELIDELGGTPALAHRAVLRGMCTTVLRRWFIATWEAVDLHRGDPFPLPERPLHLVMSNLTPNPATTIDAGQLLAGTAFRIFDKAPTGTYVRLDFRRRDELDAATWRPEEEPDGQLRRGTGLPVIASVHPWADGSDLTVTDPDGDGNWWFGVRPSKWQLADVLDQLRTAVATSAAIAVLPELSLPDPTALQDAVASDPASYPALIVAGSAHHTEGSARANECYAYLNGSELLRHRKVHPFSTRYLGPGHRFPTSRPEGITSEPKCLTVAAGSHTHLAVVICADLNDLEIPPTLDHLCVNILLVPSLSPSVGSFRGVAGSVASRCQAIVAIVNGAPLLDPDDLPPEEPFAVLAATPTTVADLVRAYPPPAAGRRGVGRLDPNSNLVDAFTWP